MANDRPEHAVTTRALAQTLAFFDYFLKHGKASEAGIRVSTTTSAARA